MTQPTNKSKMLFRCQLFGKNNFTHILIPKPASTKQVVGPDILFTISLCHTIELTKSACLTQKIIKNDAAKNFSSEKKKRCFTYLDKRPS